MFGIPAGELALLALAIVIGGVLTGLLAGVFGVGGGAIIVPILYEIFRIVGVSEDIRVQLCVGSGLPELTPRLVTVGAAERRHPLARPDAGDVSNDRHAAIAGRDLRPSPTHRVRVGRGRHHLDRGAVPFRPDAYESVYLLPVLS